MTITATERGPTADVLDRMGSEGDGESDGRHRYRVSESGPGAVVDLDVDPDAARGSMGVGCVHHVAFRTPNDETQAEWQRELRDAGLQVTEVKDRQYFPAIYFREPGGVLFEIATDRPGFTRDEDRESLGEDLKLPPWLEDDRRTIEANLPELESAARAGR